MRTIDDFLREIKEWKEMFQVSYDRAIHLEERLIEANIIISKYQEFFTNNGQYCNWMRDFNEDFKRFKASPYYKAPISTDDNEPAVE